MRFRCSRLLPAALWPAVSTEAFPSHIISGVWLGAVPDASRLVSRKLSTVETAKVGAAETLRGILRQHWGANGDEIIHSSMGKVVTDNLEDLHIRYQQHIQGKPVEGANIVMHLKLDGTVYAVNGEFTPGDEIVNETPEVACDAAVATALQQVKYARDALTGKWVSNCELGAVQPQSGPATLAFKRMIQWIPTRGETTLQRAIVFASVVNGDLVAFHPKTFGARALETYDCFNSSLFSILEYLMENLFLPCHLASNSTEPISTVDPAVNDAHNNAILTYDYLYEKYQRDSFDGDGTTIVSLTHVQSTRSDPSFEFYATPPLFYYGDGDGVKETHHSKALDFIAHEITHGITAYSSGLDYHNEPGALNEAISDIMGAAVDRFKGGKDEDLVWEMFEDLNLENNTVGVRNLADPMKYKFPDFYYERYERYDGYNLDFGGVHWNSGIVTLAFYLMVKGGTHPRGKTTIVVPAIDADFDTSLQKAVDIFYYANVGCLTSQSTFQDALYCTKLFANGAEESVTAAWEAVGVRPIVPLQDGVPLPGQQLLKGSVQEYTFPTSRGTGYTCKTTGTDGDADLFTSLDVQADPFPYSRHNDCSSIGNPTSNEVCFGSVYFSGYTVSVLLKATESYSNVTLTCMTECGKLGDSCIGTAYCCAHAPDGTGNLVCDGPTRTNHTCKKCKSINKRCARSSQCCDNTKCKNGRCA